MCVHLKIEAEEKFPQDIPQTTFAAIGGFVFLRYICPAIIVPHKYGLLESKHSFIIQRYFYTYTNDYHRCLVQPLPEIQRDLLLVSKVLQTVANGTSFGSKEEYMMPLNLFVSEYQPKILVFLDKLATVVCIQLKTPKYHLQVLNEN
jgi:hypothetical protein